MKLFGTKVDHPLADPDEVQRVLKSLPAQDPSAALDSAAAWYESLISTAEFRPERRLEVILQLDETVLPHTRRLARDYLVAPRQTRAHEFRQWQINYSYWTRLAEAYEDILRRCREDEKAAAAIKPQMALLCARHLNACGSRLKWQQFRYGPITSDLWSSAGQTWLDGLRARVNGLRVNLYSQATTPEAEYLRLLILYSSSPDTLLPVEIEITERLIAHLLPNFSLTDLARPENVYWVDAAKPLPPTRLARIPEITPTLRFYATGSALEMLSTLRASIDARNALPGEINFGGQYSPRLVLQVIDHLMVCWAPMPPMRHHERRNIKSRMAVVGRLDAICLQLIGQPDDDGDRVESWVVDDVSLGGIGAQVALVGKDWLRVGSLVAMQPEGGSSWLLGIARRFVRESEAIGTVGIETVSKNPTGHIADSQGLPTPVLLLDPPLENRELRAALSIAAWEERKPLLVEVFGKFWRLAPGTLVETGAGHAIGTFVAKTAS